MSPLSSGQPKVSGTLRSSKRRLEKLHPSLIKTLRGPGAGWGGDGQERGLGAPSSSRRDSQPRGPSPEAEGLECGGWKGREGQRRREDKPVVICLFNWLRCSEESCVVILARAGPGPSARLQACAVWGCRGGPSLPFGRAGDRVGGSGSWSEVAFASPAFQKFKTVIQ